MLFSVGASTYLGVLLPLALLEGTLAGDLAFKSALVGETIGVTIPPLFLFGVTGFSTFLTMGVVLLLFFEDFIFLGEEFYILVY